MTTAPAQPQRQRPPRVSKLRLRNSRSWRGDHEIDLAPGLNVFVGRSDAGKTNIFRAMQDIVRNESARVMLTDGEDSGSVFVGFEDGTAVALQKGPKKNAYEIVTGGSLSAFQSVGSSVPDPVAKALALGDVDLAGAEVNLHLSPQRGPAFGVDCSPAVLAKIVGTVSGLDVVYRALKIAEDARRATDAARKNAEDRFVSSRDGYRSAKGRLDTAALDAAEARATEACARAEDADKRLSGIVAIKDDLTLSLGAYRKCATDAVAVQKAVDRADLIVAGMRRSAGIVSASESLRSLAAAAAENARAAEAHAAEIKTIEAKLARIAVCPACGRPMKGGAP